MVKLIYFKFEQHISRKSGNKSQWFKMQTVRVSDNAFRDVEENVEINSKLPKLNYFIYAKSKAW